MQGLQLTGFGDPAEVVQLINLPDVGPPGPGEIVIEVEASPIEPTDLYIIAGVYGVLPQLPSLQGCQGVGRVVAVGAGVTNLKVGDRTLVPPLGNAWVSRVKVSAPWLRPLPEDIDVNQLSMLAMNPATAYVLLTEFVTLKAGDWVLQNGSNSSVGRAVIPIAKSRGIKTVSIVRRPELVDDIKALGSDVVLVDGPDLPKHVAEATGGAKIDLALDCVGGDATQRLLDSIALYGTVAIYSGMSGQPATVSNPLMIFRGQSMRAFWIMNWIRIPGNIEKYAQICDEMIPLFRSGQLDLPVVAELGLGRFIEAFEIAAKLNGKVIFKPNADE